MRIKDTQPAGYLPLDLRGVSRERHPESAAVQGKKPREQGEAGKFSKWESISKCDKSVSSRLEAGTGKQIPWSVSRGKARLLRDVGGEQDTLLHSCEDA